MIEHVRNFTKIRLSPSGYHWKSARIHESLYQCSLLNGCFCSIIWVNLMARVALKTLFGTAFPEADGICRIFVFGGILVIFQSEWFSLNNLTRLFLQFCLILSVLPIFWVYFSYYFKCCGLVILVNLRF